MSTGFKLFFLLLSLIIRFGIIEPCVVDGTGDLEGDEFASVVYVSVRFAQETAVNVVTVEDREDDETLAVIRELVAVEHERDR